MSYDDWGPYISIAERKQQVSKVVKAMIKEGHNISPVSINSPIIATTFWGKAWCKNLQTYSDSEGRLGSGRSYARYGAVVDLQITQGVVSALVQGSSLYTVSIKIKPVPTEHWEQIRRLCLGQIASVVELLTGKLSNAVMAIIVEPNSGLFPLRTDMRLSCTCLDSASMCKHVAAALYGVGARLDVDPSLLFQLRCVDYTELMTSPLALGLEQVATPGTSRMLEGTDLSSLFGLELD